MANPTVSSTRARATRAVISTGIVVAMIACGSERNAPIATTEGSATTSCVTSTNGAGAYCVGDPSTQAGQPPSNASLDTYIGHTNYLQIDWTGGTSVGDMDLFSGADFDGTGPVNFPSPVSTGVTPTWVDWNDLAYTNDCALGDGATALQFSETAIENHRVRDLNVGHEDPTAFPQNNSCVGSASVEKKFDLTYVGAASNDDYVYLIVQRSGNNGDGGYYWIFTQLAPQTVTNGKCTSWLQYPIVQGDVLVVGQFSPSSGASVTVYKAQVGTTANPVMLGVQPATDPTTQVGGQSVWGSGSTSVAIVNTTDAAPGAWASAGVDPNALDGCDLQHNIVAEAAVPISQFGASSCGTSRYGSVVTRSSGSNSTTQDMKDLAGPAKFNFGLPLKVTLTASTPNTCKPSDNTNLDDSVTFTAHVTGGSGSETFTWHGCTPLSTDVAGTCTLKNMTSCASQQVYVTVNDASCPSADSPKLTYSKQTTVTVTSP